MPTTRGARAVSPDQTGDDEQAAGVVAMPQFLPPRERPQDAPETVTFHPAEAPEATRGTHPHDEDASAVADDEPAEARTAAPSPESTGKPAPGLRPLATAAQVKTAGVLVEAMLMGATALLNKRGARFEGDDRWMMSAAERKAIAGPFARILARRSPVPTSGQDASDIADGVEGVVGLVQYVLGQLLAERPDPGFVPAVAAVPTDEPPAPAGPGAVLSPLDPAYRVG